MKASADPPPETDQPINSRPSGRAPAFQFYARDYLADANVMLMTLEEEGAYIRALAYCWVEGSIPADDAKLSRLLKGANVETLNAVKGCFVNGSEDGGRLLHPRLEIEREKQRQWREKSAEGGHKYGKSKRANKLQTKGWSKGGLTTVHRVVEPNTYTAFASASALAFASALASASPSATSTTASPKREEAARSAGGGLLVGPEGPPVLKSHGRSLPENPNDEDAHTIMKIVVDAIGVTTRFPKEAIFTQAQHELKKYPGDIEGISKGMIGAYEEFTLCYQQGKVRQLIGAEKFFGEGRWNSWQSWGFRKGTRPQSGYVEYAPR